MIDPMWLRVFVFANLIIIAIIDIKSKLVYPALPTINTIFGLLWLYYQFGLPVFGDYIHWIGIGIISFTMKYLEQAKVWENGDTLTIVTALLSLYTTEALLFGILCALSIALINIVNRKRNLKLKEFPYIPIIAIAYPISTFLM